jgi:predicted nucleic acid-binding protein
VTDLYVDSSAALRWLLRGGAADRIGAALADATNVVASDLTSAEVRRSLRRLAATGALGAEARDLALRAYESITEAWQFHEVGEPVLRKAEAAFPIEPVRTLDAIHLATAAIHAAHVGPVAVLSTDDRVRQNAEALGMTVLP